MYLHIKHRVSLFCQFCRDRCVCFPFSPPNMFEMRCRRKQKAEHSAPCPVCADLSGVSATSTRWPSQPNCCSRGSTSTRSSSWTGSVNRETHSHSARLRVSAITSRLYSPTAGRSPRQRDPASLLRRPQRALHVHPSLRRRQLLPRKRSA